MKKPGGLLAIIGLLSLFISACGGGGSGSSGGGTASAPTAPANISAVAGVSSVTVNWISSVGATSYNIYYGTSPGVSTTSTNKVIGVIGSQYNLPNLTNGTTYYFVVTAVNVNGESNKSLEVSATPAAVPLPPAAPTSLTATANNGLVTLSWAASPGASSYNIYYGTSPGVNTASLNKAIGLTGSPHNVLSLTNGTTYYFVVTALNVNGESAVSLEVSATPAAVQLPPAVPTSLTAAAANSQVTLGWVASPGATSYNVYAAVSSPVIPGAATLLVSGINGTSTTIGSLTNNTTYFFTVTALNANGESGTSNEVSTTPSIQYDLAGGWNFIHFYAGPTRPGWVFGTATIDGSGNISLSNVITDSGTPPGSGTVNWTLNADRSINETGNIAGNLSDSHLIMSASKQIVVGTSSDGLDRLIRIYIKQVPGVIFSSSDIANTSFVFHDLHSGSDNLWAYGSGSINSSLQQAISAVNTPTGPGTPPASSTLSISAAGLVTSSDPAFRGIMTPDKKNIFSITTNGGQFKLRIFQVTGQTYALSDLNGLWYEHSIASSSSAPDWEHSNISFNSTGIGNYSNYVSSTGPGANTVIGADLSTTGVISKIGATDVNGFMSFNKDLFVITSNWNLVTGQLYALTVNIR